MTADLVVFGCGYVGTALVRKARERDWRVIALTRNRERAASLSRDGVRTVVADLADVAWHTEIPRDVGLMVNCVSASGGGLPGYWHAYVAGMKSILTWAGGGQPTGTFVYTSSTSVYAGAGGAVVDEDSQTGGSETAEPLLEAERMLLAEMSFARAFILRLSGIYGPSRHYLLDQICEGVDVLPGTGRHRLNLVHRDDIVSAIFACLDAKRTIRGGLFNVTGGATRKKSELVQWLAARAGRREPVFAHDAGILGPTPGLVRGRSGRAPDRIVSNQRIRDVLGWTPRYPDFESGYEQIFAEEGATRVE